ncbi:MAG: DUF4349 domain-containing protein [Mucilaginibacter sp.]
MKTKTLMMLIAGAVLLAACKNRGKYEADSAVADSVKADSIALLSDGSKLVKTAGMGFKVKNVQQTTEKIAALTANYKGMVTHHRITSVPGVTHDVKVSDDSVMRVSAFYTTGEMIVKVPAEKLETYLDSVGRLGIYINHSSMDIDDKSLDYLSSQLKLKNRSELVNKEKKGKVVIKDPNAVLNLKDDLVDEQIGNRKIDDAVKYSVVSLSYYQSNAIVKEMIANDNPSDYSIPFFSRLGLAFENGWYVFKEAVLLLVNVWAFLLAGIIVWWAIRVYKRKPDVKSNVA